MCLEKLSKLANLVWQRHQYYLPENFIHCKKCAAAEKKVEKLKKLNCWVVNEATFSP